MNLTIEQVRNLNILADFMDGLNDPKFTMLSVRHGCGAPACAYGWEQTIPEFIKSGITDTLSFDGRFFGVSDELFRGSLNEHIKTPQQWAAYCRAFLKSNGYTTTDHFKTFMDRVMVPVDTGQLEERERDAG